MRASIALLFLVVMGSGGAAFAYPQFQLSTGNVRCNQCHFAPAGGGLLNNYGRSEAGDTISSGGNGAFLHGLWEPPSWLALGADFRLAEAANNEQGPNGVDSAFFPMQADLYVHIRAGHFDLAFTGGVRGSERPVDPSFASRLISQEHYLMWSEGPTGWYVRAGRFFAPFGLRLVEHTAYVERFLGFNLLEETYNLSGGYVGDDWELHLTAFIPDFVRDAVGERGSGGAAYFERRQGRNFAWGAQAKVSVGDEQNREIVGLVGKGWFEGPKIQVLAEADFARLGIDNVAGSRWQFVGYLGAAWRPVRGWMFQLMLERWDEDLAVKGVARDALDLEIQWFPIAHVEVGVYGRVQLIGTGSDDGSPSEVVLLQAHYYL